MNKLMNFIESVINRIIIEFQSICLTILEILKDVLLWFIDQILTVAIAILNSATSALNFNPASYFADLPPVVIQVIGLIGLGTCMQIVIASLLIRLLLQTIPFVRWGS